MPRSLGILQLLPMGFRPAIGQNSYKLIGALTPLDWANDPNEDDSSDVKEAKREIATSLAQKAVKLPSSFQYIQLLLMEILKRFKNI